MSPAASHSSENPELNALLASYLGAVDRGEQPDRQQLIDRHPQFADELRAFFAINDQLEVAVGKSPIANPLVAQPPIVKPPIVQPPVDAAPFAETILGPKSTSSSKFLGGRYKLLENIGEGGMGSVWVAEQQQPVKRKVAIKLIKAGMDSRQILARFEAERQALAMMDHPNIAKVFDGGVTEQGHPYFVMEYVKGVPFTEYCDRAKLSLKERLELFIPVCQAVQHAHHKGIVHRDLKPSNILVCLYDGRPVPKVIDFGLAKALHQPLTEQTLHTGHGVMVGTPLYMSPEQAEHNNLDVDTRTDIYSLGVVLYELLTGTTPLERQQLNQAVYAEVLRLIKEVEPPKPSTRLSGSLSFPSIAAQRSIDPRHLPRSLAGDLDWIVMKSLEKERSRRYDTATGLARDIERFLNEEAVEACPPSTAYRLRKFVKKHRGQVIAAGVIAATLVIGIIGTTWGLFRARTAEHAATLSEKAATLSEQKARTSESKAIGALEQVANERDAKEVERQKAVVARNAESQQRDKAERHLIDSLVGSIGYGSDDKLNPTEIKSFVEWSALSDSRLQLRALEAVFGDPFRAPSRTCDSVDRRRQPRAPNKSHRTRLRQTARPASRSPDPDRRLLARARTRLR